MAKPADPAAPTFDPNAVTAQAASQATPDNPFNMSIDSLVNNGQKTTHRQGAEADSIAFHLQTPALSVDRQTSAMDMIKGLYTMPKDQLKQLQRQMVDAGYLAAHDSGGTGMVTGLADRATLNAYQLVLGDVFNYQQNPDTKDMTIDDLLKQRAEAYKAGGGTKTTKTTITQFSPIQAQGFLQGAYEKYLGRGATQAEVEAFSSSLNAYSQANPSVTSQSVDQSGNKIAENDSASVDPSTMAENDALQNHTSEAKGYAGDNTLLAIMSHLGLPQ